MNKSNLKQFVYYIEILFKRRILEYNIKCNEINPNGAKIKKITNNILKNKLV